MKAWLIAIAIALSVRTSAHGALNVQYPAEPRTSGITDGYAVVGWIVMPDGSIGDAATLEASHAAFGRAVLGALPRRLPPDPVARLPRFDALNVAFRRGDSTRHGKSMADLGLMQRSDRSGAAAIRSVPTSAVPGAACITFVPPRYASAVHTTRR